MIFWVAHISNSTIPHVETFFVQGKIFVLNQNKPPCFDSVRRYYLGRIKFLHVEMPYTTIPQPSSKKISSKDLALKKDQKRSPEDPADTSSLSLENRKYSRTNMKIHYSFPIFLKRTVRSMFVSVNNKHVL